MPKTSSQPNRGKAVPPPRTSLGSAKTRSQKSDNTALPRRSKLDEVIALLRLPGGVTIADVMRATGWQRHSVRGAFAGAVKKRLGQPVISELIEGERRYRAADPAS